MKKLLENKLAAIILAGGQSSRMGQDKALIMIDGIPLLEKICQIARECTSEVYVITFWPERYSSIIPTQCHLIREVLLTGENQPHGPLVGFAQALTQVKREWVLLLACDLPCLTASVLQKWLITLNIVSEDIQAVLPRRHGRWEPVCGFYRRDCLSSLNQFIQQGGRAFQVWLQTISIQELVLDNPRILFNCNSPEDLQEIQI